MDRGHQEDAFAGAFEVEDLNDDAQRSTTNKPTMASTISCLVTTGDGAERAAQGEAAGVAHEDRRRGGVIPQEAEAAADQGGDEDHQLARAGDGVDAQVFGEIRVVNGPAGSESSG